MLRRPTNDDEDGILNPGNNELEDDGDDEDDDAVSKLGGAPHLYQEEHTAHLIQSNDRANRPGARHSSRHPEHRATIAAATRPGGRHKFDDRVDFVKDRDGVSKSVAMQRARLEYPGDYESYQKFLAGSSAQEQYARRSVGTTVGKREPDLVELEMRKGVTRGVAAQRVAQLHGYRGFDTPSRITKRRADLAWEFAKRVDEIMNMDGVDATEATRRARLEDRALYVALQRAG
jgi:hypothetical protein